MSTLVRWNPTRDLINMRNEMDRLMEGFFNVTPQSPVAKEGWGLALDIAENEDRYLVTAVVPGVTPEDIDVTVEDGVLTIRGEVKKEFEESGEEEHSWRFHIRERRFGQFQRSLRLPNDVDLDGIQARHENGLLTLVLPKSEAAKPRRISIQ